VFYCWDLKGSTVPATHDECKKGRRAYDLDTMMFLTATKSFLGGNSTGESLVLVSVFIVIDINTTSTEVDIVYTIPPMFDIDCVKSENFGYFNGCDARLLDFRNEVYVLLLLVNEHESLI
jgi:hypothetical protein